METGVGHEMGEASKSSNTINLDNFVRKTVRNAAKLILEIAFTSCESLPVAKFSLITSYISILKLYLQYLIVADMTWFVILEA